MVSEHVLQRPPRRRAAIAVVAVAVVVALAAVGGWLVVRGAGQDAPAALPSDPRPTAAVALGDSFASGEAAGSYARDADGSVGPCHRSAVAQIHRAELPGIDHAVNLACSGATTGNLRLDGQGLHGQPPQAAQLRDVADTYNVELVVVTVGANDLDWGQLLLDCVLGLLPTAESCQERWGPRLPERTAQISTRIQEAVGDIRAVLRDAGQDTGDYQLVLQSYAAPVPREPREMSLAEQLTAGCPVPDDAMAWANDELMPQLADMVATAAEATGARFLDLSRAFDGHQVCAEGATADTRWVAGLELDAELAAARLFGDPQQTDRLRAAFHPNARGHAQLGRCLSQFAAADGDRAVCEATADGGARVH